MSRWAWILMLGLAGLVGCGYSTGLTVPEGTGKTVGIEFFENRTPERDIEREFHVELSRAVIDYVRAPLVPPEEADLVIRGTMVRFSRRDGVRSGDNELLESGIHVQVQASLWRRRRPDEPAPAEPTRSRGSDRSRLDYNSRRGLTYERDFTEQPVLGSTFNPDLVVIGQAAPAPWVGYLVDDVGGEAQARQRVLRNAADRLVLDLFAPMN